ncbi:hypothetical protein BKA65DRAFT_488144 [Rhexocercosporidium sp. MPI-PUGE-AT-0058]|nr:hypothetical protein BKA65DRAFT_488144 [Rhexocercosporidium sp. MPI-PUGE-AT-0058]
MKLTNDTINALKNGIPLDDFDATIHDAVLVTRALEYLTLIITSSDSIKNRFLKERDLNYILLYIPSTQRKIIESGFLWQLLTFLKFKGFKAYLLISLDYLLMSHSDTFRLYDRLVAISSLARIYGDMIRNPTYVARLWKEDLIRGLLWHIKGVTLIPRGSVDDVLNSYKAFPSWSWASVRYEAVKNDLKTNNSLYSFSAVKSGSVTIASPLRRLLRLYNKEWRSQKASIGTGLLHLLVLEAISNILNSINVYRRAGILKLRYIDRLCYALPKLIAIIKKMETLITTRLGLRKELRTVLMPLNAVFMEVEREDWVKETVMII